MNALKTGILMVLIFTLFIFIGYGIGGPQGMIIALVLAVLMNGITYWFSDKIVLAMYRAHEIPPERAPNLHRTVEEIAARAGIPKPKIYVIESSSPNAFATGRNPEHAVVAVTTGIMRLLNDRELRGVLAHELAHVGNRDILIQSIVATVAAAITTLAMLARFAAIFGGMGGHRDDRRGGGGNVIGLLIMAILAPIAAMVIQLWISRTREYAADETGARWAEDPLALASALRKLEAGARQIPLEANPATQHMFIVKPLSGQGLASIFSTHPPIPERVARLERLAQKFNIR